MLTEIDVLGAFAPAIVVWFAGALAAFILADALLTRAGFFRLFWHAPLARFAWFVIFFCTVGLALS